MQAERVGKPVLWQIKVSHYNEKVRWALDFKRVPHRRRAPLPMFGTIPVAVALTGGTTLPILQLDGRAIGDSTRIIAAVEERYPEPPLYPEDPAELRRALELEELFDEQLAPYVRQLVWHETTRDREAFMSTALPDSSVLARTVLGFGAPLSEALLRARYGIDEDSAADARERLWAAMDRLESEIEPSGYLAGERFSVADLTAAALWTPVLLPPQRPHGPRAELPEPLRAFRSRLEQRRGAGWVFEIYRRHR